MGPGMNPTFVLILFGDARFSSSSRGLDSAPVRWFRHILPAYGHTLETCKFRTSITCSACLRPTKHARLLVSGPELDELPVGQRRVLNKNVQVQARPHQHPMSCRTALLHAAHVPMHAWWHSRADQNQACTAHKPSLYSTSSLITPAAPSRPDGNWNCDCLQVCTHCHINWNPRLQRGEEYLDRGLESARPHRTPQASAVPAMSSHVKALA